MADVTVGSAAALTNALKTASAGDVIRLEGGTYSGVSIRGLALDGVTIQSASNANPAVFTDLTMRDASGLTFRDVTFFVDPAQATSVFQVVSSKDVHFHGIRMHGSLDGNPQNDKNGLVILQSSDVSVTRSHFFELRVPLNHIDGSKLLFTENVFVDTRLGGIWGGGSSDVTVSRNLFRDFYPAEGDHPDAINFWTTGTTAPAKNISVTENVFIRGEGYVSQGIFFRDQQNKLPFENVTISDNLIVGGMYNGIAVVGATGLSVTNNIVLALPDAKSRIYLEGVGNVALTGNTTSDILFGAGNSGMQQSGNSEIGFVQDGGKGHISGWFAAHADIAALAKSMGYKLSDGVWALTPDEPEAPSQPDAAPPAAPVPAEPMPAPPEPAPEPAPAPAPLPAPAEPSAPDPVIVDDMPVFSPGPRFSRAAAADEFRFFSWLGDERFASARAYRPIFDEGDSLPAATPVVEPPSAPVAAEPPSFGETSYEPVREFHREAFVDFGALFGSRGALEGAHFQLYNFL